MSFVWDCLSLIIFSKILNFLDDESYIAFHFVSKKFLNRCKLARNRLLTKSREFNFSQMIDYNIGYHLNINHFGFLFEVSKHSKTNYTSHWLFHFFNTKEFDLFYQTTLRDFSFEVSDIKRLSFIITNSVSLDLSDNYLTCIFANINFPPAFLQKAEEIDSLMSKCILATANPDKEAVFSFLIQFLPFARFLFSKWNYFMRVGVSAKSHHLCGFLAAGGNFNLFPKRDEDHLYLVFRTLDLDFILFFRTFVQRKLSDSNFFFALVRYVAARGEKLTEDQKFDYYILLCQSCPSTYFFEKNYYCNNLIEEVCEAVAMSEKDVEKLMISV